MEHEIFLATAERPEEGNGFFILGGGRALHSEETVRDWAEQYPREIFFFVKVSTDL